MKLSHPIKLKEISMDVKRIVLKPCPFCGSNAIITMKHVMYRVECLNRWGEDQCPMNMRTHHKATRLGAIEAWNTRKGD
jgi:hypothetical protein